MIIVYIAAAIYIPPFFIIKKKRMIPLLIKHWSSMVAYISDAEWNSEKLFIHWLNQFEDFVRLSAHYQIVLHLDNHGISIITLPSDPSLLPRNAKRIWRTIPVPRLYLYTKPIKRYWERYQCGFIDKDKFKSTFDTFSESPQTQETTTTIINSTQNPTVFLQPAISVNTSNPIWPSATAVDTRISNRLSFGPCWCRPQWLQVLIEIF